MPHGFRFPDRYLPGFFLLTLLLSACSSTAPQSMVSPAGENAQMIYNLLQEIFWAAMAVFVIVEGLLIYAVIRFRRKAGEGLPAQIHGNTPIEVAWTVAPALLLLVIFVLTVRTLGAVSSPVPGKLNVKVIGHQWWWEFQYSDLNIVTANELHVPVGETVNLSLESKDVIHSFWVPQLAGKTDVIPGYENRMWIRVDQLGTYSGQCAEFCGVEHALMRFRVVAQTEEDFQAWVKSQQAAPAAPTGEAARGAEVFARSACVGCHTIEGTPGKGTVGPNLTHFGSRTTIAAGTLENTPENLARWLRDPQAVKPGNLMPNLHLSEDEIAALVAYLESLK